MTGFEPGEPVVDHGGERVGHDVVAARQRAGNLDGEVGVTAAPGEDPAGIDALGALVHEERHLGFVEGEERALHDPSLARERANHALDGGVVAQLARSRATRDQDARRGIPDHVVQERRGRLVEPLQVVEHDRERRALGHARGELRHGAEEASPVDARAVGSELGKQRGEVAPQAFDGVSQRDRAQRVDPRPVRADHLALEGASCEDGSSCGSRRVGDDLEEARLSDTGLAEKQERGGRRSTRDGSDLLDDLGALGSATDERLTGGSAGRVRGRGSRRRAEGRVLRLPGPRRRGRVRRGRRPARRLGSHERARMDQARRGLGPELRRKDPSACLVLRKRLSLAPEPGEEDDHVDVSRLGERIDRDARPRVHERRLGAFRPGAR